MTDTFDYDALARRLRDRILETKQSQESTARTQESPLPSSALTSDTPTEIQHQFYVIRSLQDISKVSFTSHRRLFGPLLIRVRKFMRELLIPIFSQQVGFNTASVELAELMQQQISSATDLIAKLQADNAGTLELRQLLLSAERRGDSLDARLESLSYTLDSLEGRLGALRDDLEKNLSMLRTTLKESVSSTLRDTLTDHRSSLSNLTKQLSSLKQLVDDLALSHRERIARVERKLRRLIYEITSTHARASTSAALSPTANVADSFSEIPPNFDYAGFEERVRGSERELAAKQRRHLKHFAGVDNVLDIGCGRGEFLEVLRQANIKAHGVDLNLDMILTCREKDLTVVQQEAIEYLRSLPDEALGGIYSAQFIEHLPADKVLELIDLAHRKLSSNGILLIETLNPESLFVLYRWFWMDPTHQRLVHPETLRYSLECAGFREILIEFASPPEVPTLPSLALNGVSPEALGPLNDWASFLNRLLFSPQEYAAVARR